MPGVDMWPCQRCGHAHGRPVTEAFMCSNRECYCCYPKSAISSYARAQGVAAAQELQLTARVVAHTSAEPPPSTDSKGRGSQGEGGGDLGQAHSHPKSDDPNLRQDALVRLTNSNPLTQGGWSAHYLGFGWAFYPRRVQEGLGARVRFRQDCDDLIALLVELRERLS